MIISKLSGKQVDCLKQTACQVNIFNMDIIVSAMKGPEAVPHYYYIADQDKGLNVRQMKNVSLSRSDA